MLDIWKHNWNEQRGSMDTSACSQSHHQFALILLPTHWCHCIRVHCILGFLLGRRKHQNRSSLCILASKLTYHWRGEVPLSLHSLLTSLLLSTLVQVSLANTTLLAWWPRAEGGPRSKVQLSPGSDQTKTPRPCPSNLFSDHRTTDQKWSCEGSQPCD